MINLNNQPYDIFLKIEISISAKIGLLAFHMLVEDWLEAFGISVDVSIDFNF